MDFIHRAEQILGARDPRAVRRARRRTIRRSASSPASIRPTALPATSAAAAWSWSTSTAWRSARASRCRSAACGCRTCPRARWPQAQKFVREQLARAKLLQGGQGRPFYAVGGTWRNLARLHMERGQLSAGGHASLRDSASRTRPTSSARSGAARWTRSRASSGSPRAAARCCPMARSCCRRSSRRCSRRRSSSRRWACAKASSIRCCRRRSSAPIR